MIIIKSFIKELIILIVDYLDKFSIGKFIEVVIVKKIFSNSAKVIHSNTELLFATPNWLTKWRAETFSSKEPETIDWINTFENDSVLWDIGANVGIYSCYAAKLKNCKVFSFEPSVFNLELLARNIQLNNLGNLITIVPIPLTDKLMNSKLNMTTTVWGGAMSTFHENYGHDGRIEKFIFSIPTIGISMDYATKFLKISQPDYTKMDIDGIEHLVLNGGANVLSKTKSILIEVNDNFITQAIEVNFYLKQAGFYLKEKRHADYFENSATDSKYTFNQIWNRIPEFVEVDND